MFEIEWKHYSSTEDRHIIAEWLFKRRKQGDNYVYEVWRHGVLDKNNLGYFELLNEYRDILRLVNNRR